MCFGESSLSPRSLTVPAWMPYPHFLVESFLQNSSATLVNPLISSSVRAISLFLSSKSFSSHFSTGLPLLASATYTQSSPPSRRLAMDRWVLL